MAVGLTMADCLDPAKAKALAAYLQTCMQADQVVITAAARLSGGAIQDNYGISVDCRGGPYAGSHELVVRSDAPSKVAASMTRAQEFRVLQVAYEAGVTVPQPLWCCEDPAVIGTRFAVMARVPGSASARALVKQMVDEPQQARLLVRQLGTELARIHSVTPTAWNAARLSFLPMPAKTPALGRVQQYRAALDAIPRPHIVLEWALNWLEDHAVDSGLRALCHGDFRSGNYLVQNGRLTAVLDWEFASWGDPYEDLGWLCARSWRFGASEREVGGIGDRADLYDAWEAGTGHAVDDRQVRYWEIMGMLRWAIIALQQGERHLSGEQRSLELALTGRMLPEIELDIITSICQFEGRPVTAERLIPVATRPAGAPAQHPLAPDAGDALATARQVMLHDLLPQLPKDAAYDALMVANTMGIAARELQDQGHTARALHSALHKLLKEMWSKEMGSDPDLLKSGSDPIFAAENSAGGLRSVLARLLRKRALPAEHEVSLRQLLLQETCSLLAINNPKYLTGHQESARRDVRVEAD